MRFLWIICALALASCASSSKAPANGAPTEDDARLRFSGVKELSERGLRRAIALDVADWTESGFERAFIDDAAFQLVLYYRDNGFHFAEVDYEAVDGSPQASLIVREGPRVRVRGVDVEGLGAEGGLSASEIASYFDGGRTSLLGTDDPLFVQTLVDSAAGRIRAEYRARGFRDVQVDPASVTFSTNREQARIAVTLRPGPRYLIASVAPLDETVRAALDEEAWKQLVYEFTTRQNPNAAVGVREPRPESPTVAAELRGAVLARVKERGHLDAVVRVERQVQAGATDVTLAVAVELGPVIRVGEVRFEGAPETRRKFLASRLQIAGRDGETPGEIANPTALRDGISRLYRTGLFGRVDAKFEGTGAERDLVLLFDERPSLELFIEPGYGSYEGPRLRIGAREKNLFGTGRQLRAESTVAARALRFETGLTDPWFLKSNLIADLSVSLEEREQPSFRSVERGTGFFLTREWFDDPGLATTFGYQFRNSEARDIEVVDDAVSEALSQVNLSSLKISQVFDRRDNPLLTESGTVSRVSFEWGDESLGSDLDFWRATGSVSGYRRLRRGTVLAATLRAGAIAPLNDDDTVPLQERFFAGGENSVRSFKESELGPLDGNGEALGGETVTTASLELRQTLWTTGFQAALFTDAGMVTSKLEDFGDTEDLGWAVGLGLRYLLPVGPLRMDLAANPEHERNQDDWVLHIAVGLSF